MKKAIILICLGFFMAAGISAEARQSKFKSSPRYKRPFARTAQVIPGEVLVKFRSNFTVRDVQTFNQQVHANANDRQQALQAFHQYYRTTALPQPFLGWQRLKLAAGQTVAASITELSKNALVESVEANGRVYADALSTSYTPFAAAFNDPMYTNGLSQWWINRTKGDAAKSGGAYFTGSSDVIVAVLDTGIDGSHPEFSGRLVAGRNIVGNNTDTTDDNEWIDTIHILGHGTHAAGMIAAMANNHVGIAGMAWDSHVKIMPVKVMDATASGTYADIGNGITWAVDNGAAVLSMSFGTYFNSQPVRDACSYAANPIHSVIMVASAGNDNANISPTSIQDGGPTPYYPAGYNNVICVGATTADDWCAYYSNYSSPTGVIDCVAPGGALESYAEGWFEDNGVTSTAISGYTAVDGTSFAAPQVAGLAALLKLQWPSRTPSEIETLIKSSCDWPDFYSDPEGTSAVYGAGRINIQRALMVLNPTQTITPTPTISPTSSMTPTITPTPTITITFTQTATATISPTSSITPTQSATITHSPTTVPLRMSRDTFRAFPQPCNKTVNFAYNFSGHGTIAIALFNQNSELVLKAGEQPQERGGYAITPISLQILAPGIYYVKIKLQDDLGNREMKGKIAVIK